MSLEGGTFRTRSFVLPLSCSESRVTRDSEDLREPLFEKRFHISLCPTLPSRAPDYTFSTVLSTRRHHHDGQRDRDRDDAESAGKSFSRGYPSPRRPNAPHQVYQATLDGAFPYSSLAQGDRRPLHHHGCPHRRPRPPPRRLVRARESGGCVVRCVMHRCARCAVRCAVYVQCVIIDYTRVRGLWAAS